MLIAALMGGGLQSNLRHGNGKFVSKDLDSEAANAHA
jgi:hypothetical protein